MIRKLLLLNFVILIALAAGACNYPGYSDEPSDPVLTSLPVIPPTPTFEPFTSEPADDCASALAPGLWVGSASINTVATSMGFRVINQNASIPLQLTIECDGSVTGTGVRQGEGDIRVPFALDGACTENASYQIEGDVLPGNAGAPILHLTFSTIEGAISCNLNSRISSIPSGEQSSDLSGTSFDIDLIPDSTSADRISGNQWSDNLYEDQFGDMEEMLDDANVETTTTSSWELVLQR